MPVTNPIIETRRKHFKQKITLVIWFKYVLFKRAHNSYYTQLQHEVCHFQIIQIDSVFTRVVGE